MTSIKPSRELKRRNYKISKEPIEIMDIPKAPQSGITIGAFWHYITQTLNRQAPLFASRRIQKISALAKLGQ